jgi:hypothetical protein
VQVDVRTNEQVDDLDATFAVYDGANQLVVDGRTSREGYDFGRLNGKRRVRFLLREVPLAGGKYWVTIGLESGTTGRLYHVQTQRYWFEVHEQSAARERIEVPVVVSVEDL